MKKSLILICCLLGLSILSNAQSLIVKAGGSLSTVDWSLSSTKNKLGAIGGLAFEIPLNDHFSVQPELLFHQKGFKDEFTRTSYSKGIDQSYHVKETYTLNYLESPILIKYTVGIFYFNAGPSISYAVGGHRKAERKSTNINLNGIVKSRIKYGHIPSDTVGVNTDVYFDNALDVGIQLGGGVKLFKKVIIDLRYGFGLSNLYDKHSSIFSADNKSHNRSFQLTVGYPIKLGKR